MENPLVKLIRYFSLRKNESRQAHSILPLSAAKNAMVFVRPGQADSAQTIGAVKSFFNYAGINVRILSPSESDLNCAGIIKRKLRNPISEPRNEDIFISLADTNENYAAYYEAKCSPAKFKIGINTMKEDIFDMIVTPPVNTSQSAVFASIKDYLNRIK